MPQVFYGSTKLLYTFFLCIISVLEIVHLDLSTELSTCNYQAASVWT